MSNQAVTALRHAYRRVSQGLWQWCSSREALLISLSLLALALALSYTFPQAPAHIRSDAIGYKEWLADAQVRYKNWTPLLQAAGIFWVRDTVWFRLLLAALSLFLLIALADRIAQMIWPHRAGQMIAARRPADVVTMCSTSSVEQTASRMQKTLHELGLQVRTQAHNGQTRFYAHRARWAAAGLLGLYLGLIAVVAGVAINSRWGWVRPGVQLLPGNSVPVGPQGGHSLELVSSAEESARIRANDGPEMTIRRERATYRPLSFYYRLSDRGGEWLQVSAWDENDEPLALSYYQVQPEPTATLGFAFAGEQGPRQLFIIPEEKLVVKIELQLGGEPRLQQSVYDQSDQLLGEAEVESLEEGAVTEVNGIAYRWTAAPYVIVDVAYRPGNWGGAVGAVLVVAGMAAQMIPHQQLWGLVVDHNGGSLIVMREQNGVWPAQQQSKILAILDTRGDQTS